ncbi:MAG: response regulator [Candidatus Latescibacteria bacterium]|nr:response regulator [Candidatus Latescibacterota bacterium]
MGAVEALVVDDELVARQTARRILEAEGYRVSTASSGEEGLEVFARGRFELVVSDINMPGIDGLEMIRRILEVDPEVACVVMTMLSGQQVAVEALKSGAQDFLHKPFGASELLQAAKRALKLRQELVRAHQLEAELARSKMQFECLEHSFLDAEKLSVLGQLAPRIAHEIKTPLQLISGHAELACHWLKDSSPEGRRELAEHLEAILPAVARIEMMTRQMFELGKPQGSRVEEVDLPAELDAILDEFRQLGAVKHCRIERDYHPDLPFIYADRPQLQQVFRNLILNAAQAMEECQERRLMLGVRPGAESGLVEVEVADSGNGIPAELRERIFEPFFTTKEQGRGTGLGLAIVKSVVERHQGQIEVHSSEGEGTTFRVILPVEFQHGGET